MAWRTSIPSFPLPIDMAQGPPPSDPESDGFEDAKEYQYESEGEERLATSVRNLMLKCGGDHRCESTPKLHQHSLTKVSHARAAFLAYTR